MDSKNPKSNSDGVSRLIQLDKDLSLKLSLCASSSSPLGHLRPQMKFLEYSCHGLFWIPASIILLWFCDDPPKEAFCFNLLLALILDIIFIGILKALIHRKRPDNNDKDMFITVSIDKMSCPSGHTSRAVLLTSLFVSSTPGATWLHLPLLFWCLCTCASRVMLGRHHIGDVFVGAVQGYFEYLFMDWVWAGPEKADWYLSFFRDSNAITDDL